MTKFVILVPKFEPAKASYFHQNKQNTEICSFQLTTKKKGQHQIQKETRTAFLMAPN